MGPSWVQAPASLSSAATEMPAHACRAPHSAGTLCQTNSPGARDYTYTVFGGASSGKPTGILITIKITMNLECFEQHMLWSCNLAITEFFVEKLVYTPHH